MKLTPIEANLAEAEIGKIKVLFSYKTPVAYTDDTGYYRTNKGCSQITSRHIEQWMGEGCFESSEEIDQALLDNLVK